METKITETISPEVQWVIDDLINNPNKWKFSPHAFGMGYMDATRPINKKDKISVFFSKPHRDGSQSHYSSISPTIPLKDSEQKTLVEILVPMLLETERLASLKREQEALSFFRSLIRKTK